MAALRTPIVQSVGYPTYAERFPTRVRYTDLAIAGVLNGYQQANLVILPQAQAYALLLSCLSNPKTCPILAVGDASDPRLPLPGAAIDIRTMLPRHRSASFPKLSRSSLLLRAGRGR